MVYTWDMRTRRCLSQTVDEGCLKGTALAVSPNDRYFASGSSAGVVNLYERPRHASVLEPLLPGGRLPAAVAAPAKPGAAPPLKTLMNLTTTVRRAHVAVLVFFPLCYFALFARRASWCCLWPNLGHGRCCLPHSCLVAGLLAVIATPGYSTRD